MPVNPHDKYFKYVFSQTDMAIDLIANSLSKEILSKIDLSSLKRENSSYVDEKLKEYFSDLVFSCKIENVNINISILFEHKSFVPKNPHVQIMHYMTNIWIEQEKSGKQIERVLPIYIYHGKKEWVYKSLSSGFQKGTEIFDNFTPEFNYILINLSLYTDEQIQKRFKEIYVKTSLLLLKNYYNELLLNQRLNYYLSSIDAELVDTDIEFIESTINYLLIATNIKDKVVTDELFNISEKGGKLAMTTAERLRKQGRQEGRREGRQEGRKEGRREGRQEQLKENILNFYLDNKFDIITISQLFKIDKSTVESILIEEGIEI
jgi:predicted transposase/invertase (TIGR01784 family)